MMERVREAAAGNAASMGVAPVGAAASIDGSSFGAVMADIDGPHALAAAAGRGAAPPAGGAAFGALARHLDEIGRQRLAAHRLSGDLAGAWASGMDTETLVMTMHRQARAMATYNVNVMWSAKLVGVTTGALRQLTTST